jgi:hypothetical protein
MTTVIEFIYSTVTNDIAALMTILYSVLSLNSCEVFDTEEYLQKDRIFLSINLKMFFFQLNHHLNIKLL